MKYLLILLLLCSNLFADTPRGLEFLNKVAINPLGDPKLNYEVVTPDTLILGEQPLAENERRVIIYPHPIWYVNADGSLSPITTDLITSIENGQSVLKADDNILKFEFRPNGATTYTTLDEVLTITPLRHSIEQNGEVELTGAPLNSSNNLQSNKNKIHYEGLWNNSTVNYDVLPGSVKESIIINSTPSGLTNKDWLIISYQWQSATLSPELIEDQIYWKSNDKTIFRWQPLVVFDSNGTILNSKYSIRGNRIVLQISATDLLNAVYPVTVDPTTTTGLSDSVAGISIRKSSGLSYKACYLKLLLPNMVGNTVTDATIQYNCISNYGPMNNIDLYGRATAETGEWYISSTYTYLDTLPVGTAISTGNTLTSGTGWKTFNIYGDSTKGVNKFYTTYPGGGSFTIALKWTGFTGSVTTTNASLKLGNDAALDTQAEFSYYNDAVYYPRATVTYTVGGTSSSLKFFLFL